MTRSEKPEWFVWCFLLNFLCYSLTFFLSLVLLFDAASATVPSRRLRIGQQSASDSGQINMTLAKQATQALTEGVQLYNQGKGTVESQQKAIEKLQEAVKFWRQARDQRGEAYSFMFLGLVYNKDNVGDKHKALDCYNQALRLFRVVGDGGNGAEASTLYDDWFNDQSLQATSLNNIATVYSELGETQKALDYYKQALTLLKTINDKIGQSRTLNNIGLVYSNLGENQKAIDCYNQALALLQMLGDKVGEANTLNNIGTVYDEDDELYQNRRALLFYKLASQLYHGVSDQQGEATTLNNIGVIYSKLGEKQEALSLYNAALKLRRFVGDKGGEATTLNNIGGVYSVLGDKKQALKYYNQSLPLSRQVGDKKQEATTFSNIGSVYRDTKQPTQAIKYWEQSVTITLQLRSGVGRENRKTFLESYKGTPIALIDLLLNQNQRERAFEWANLATVADLADYSRLVNAKVANPKAQKAIDQWNQKNIELESLRKQLQEKFTPELSQRVNQRQEQLNREGEDIRNRFTEAADLFETKRTDIAQLQASIQVGTTVIQPVLLTKIKNVPNTVALFIFTRDKLTVKKIPVDPAKFDSLLKQTYTSLTNRFDNQYLDGLETLYDLLIRPVEAEIQATNPKKLSFIATGKLRYIPFEALYDAKTDQYLIQKYSINYLTRLSTRSLQAKGTQNSTSAKKVLAFGNPVPKEPFNLPNANAEVESITQIFPGSEAFVNSKATLKTFKIQSPRFSILHLATHGCFQPQGCCLPKNPNCKKPDRVDLKRNTILFADQPYDIADVALLGLQNVDLIALSACQTALETNSNGEEIAGLAYLFERAGSKAVLASLWSAADETTKAIMVQFYQNLKKGMSKDEALRQAKLSQIDSHPFFWSPFVLIGDPR